MSNVKKQVLGDLTERLTSRFAEVDAGRESLHVPMSRAKSAPGHLLEFTGVSHELERTTHELEELRKNPGAGFEVELTKLRTSPYQIGGLQQSRVQSLVDNLRVNPQSTPLVVRPTAEPGFFEIVAGHHRREAFRILERSTIRAVLREFTDDEAERLVFYDNLLAPNLSDYEKYLGYSARLKSKELTAQMLAAEAGVSPAQVSKLLSFAKLPQQAQDFIRDNPKAAGLGSNLFHDLAALSTKHPERVIEAIERVANSRLSAGAAAAWVTTGERSAPEAAERTLVKRGRAKYAEVRHRGTQWVINFANEEDARKCGTKLLELVESESESTQ
jgi:ParB family transcriptional regulator, chromosome partitioning protein